MHNLWHASKHKKKKDALRINHDAHQLRPGLFGCLSTKPQRANQRSDEPWLAIFHIWKSAAHARNVLPRICFQSACSWYVTRLSSTQLCYTVHRDMTLVCEAIKTQGRLRKTIPGWFLSQVKHTQIALPSQQHSTFISLLLINQNISNWGGFLLQQSKAQKTELMHQVWFITISHTLKHYDWCWGQTNINWD